jgi:hypothetical protein
MPSCRRAPTGAGCSSLSRAPSQSSCYTIGPRVKRSMSPLQFTGMLLYFTFQPFRCGWTVERKVIFLIAWFGQSFLVVYQFHVVSWCEDSGKITLLPHCCEIRVYLPSNLNLKRTWIHILLSKKKLGYIYWSKVTYMVHIGNSANLNLDRM